MFGVKIVVTGDKAPKGENAVIIMNHRCRLDWLFFWSVVARYGELKHEKIIIKHELKHIQSREIIILLSMSAWPHG